MNIFSRMFRKLFLVKEIVSREGTVHFRRYRLLSTPWFNIYVHHILQSDMDSDMHDHPWDFSSLILKGSYIEQARLSPEFDAIYMNKYYSGEVIKHKAEDAHKLILVSKSVWTLVVTSGTPREWGYQTCQGWIDHKEYRQRKNQSPEVRIINSSTS